MVENCCRNHKLNLSLTLQVIRRGDLKPFYAPAKYVVELHPEELEALRNEPTASNNRPMMTTFSAVGHAAKLYGNNNGNKRSSYSPSTKTTTDTKFQERYRSNSLDSILVSDEANLRNPSSSKGRSTGSNNKPFLPNRNSAQEVLVSSSKASSNQRHGGRFAQNKTVSLEKRPTFEGLDKRKSWSVVDNSTIGGGSRAMMGRSQNSITSKR